MLGKEQVHEPDLFVGGIVLMIMAALIFFLAETPVAIPIVLLVVGIALVAQSRRRSR